LAVPLLGQKLTDQDNNNHTLPSWICQFMISPWT